MNKITLFGRLGKDPEMRQIQNGKSVCNFSIATTEKYNGNEETQWHNVVAWGKQAEVVSKYFKKGSRILIEGKMTYSQYESNGVKVNKSEVVLTGFNFVDSANSDNQQNNGSGFPPQQMPPQQMPQQQMPPQQNIGGGLPVESDELPF